MRNDIRQRFSCFARIGLDRPEVEFQQSIKPGIHQKCNTAKNADFHSQVLCKKERGGLRASDPKENQLSGNVPVWRQTSAFHAVVNLVLCSVHFQLTLRPSKGEVILWPASIWPACFLRKKSFPVSSLGGTQIV